MIAFCLYIDNIIYGCLLALGIVCIKGALRER